MLLPSLLELSLIHPNIVLLHFVMTWGCHLWSLLFLLWTTACYPCGHEQCFLGCCSCQYTFFPILLRSILSFRQAELFPFISYLENVSVFDSIIFSPPAIPWRASCCALSVSSSAFLSNLGLMQSQAVLPGNVMIWILMNLVKKNRNIKQDVSQF